MKTILIIIATVYGGHHTSTAEFTSASACEIAVQRVLEEQRWGSGLTAFCVADRDYPLDYRSGEPVR